MVIWSLPNMSAQGNTAGFDGSYFTSHVDFINMSFSNNIDTVTFTFVPRIEGPGGVEGSGTGFVITINGLTFNTYASGVTSSTTVTVETNPRERITSINFHGYMKATFREYQSTADLNRTFKVPIIKIDTDFLFVDTSVDWSYVLLPTYTATRNNLLFIKDKSGNAQSRPIAVISSSGEQLEIMDSRIFTIDSNWGCFTLMLNYRSSISYWHIVGYYSGMGNQTTNWPSKPAVTATTGSINYYNTDAAVARQSGDNAVYLDIPSTSINPDICIVVYCGSASGGGRNTNGNALVIRNSGAEYIDGFSGTQFPYIFCDGSMKSTGIIFISDGNKWYIVGFMDNYGWEWKNDIILPNVSVSAATHTFIANADNSGNTFKNYDISKSTLTIIKNYDDTPTYWPRACVRDSVNSNTNYYMNENYTSIEKSVSRSRFHCVWIVKEYRSNTDSYHFHPVLQYNLDILN